MTRKCYVTLRHPKMHPHTKFGIPTSKNIGDMHRTRSGTDTRTDTRTDGRTVRLLYASQSSFGGIKTTTFFTIFFAISWFVCQKQVLCLGYLLVCNDMSQNRVIHITETSHMSKSHYGDIGSLPLFAKRRHWQRRVKEIR